MKLKVYLAEIGMTAKKFSEIADCNCRYLSLIMNGRVKAGKRLTRDILKLTDGQVDLKKITLRPVEKE